MSDTIYDSAGLLEYYGEHSAADNLREKGMLKSSATKAFWVGVIMAHIGGIIAGLLIGHSC